MIRFLTTDLARAARTTKRRSRRLPPSVMALEGRTLLSSFTLHGKPDVAHTPAPAVSMLRQTHSGTIANDHASGVENTGSKLAVARIVPRVRLRPRRRSAARQRPTERRPAGTLTPASGLDQSDLLRYVQRQRRRPQQLEPVRLGDRQGGYGGGRSHRRYRL